MSRRLIVLAVVLGLTCLSLLPESTAQQANNGGRPASAPKGGADPQLDRILENWFAASKDIKKLEGKHVRFAYDYTFGVCKRAEGEFFYQAPDKGRIDLVASKVTANETAEKVSAIDSKKLTFSVEPDLPERWICDGKQILQIHDAQKEVMQFEIPKEGQGQNIMDGPLPFLFGMPPDKAKQRYDMRIIASNKDQHVLQILPRWQQDAANYKWAVIMLDAKTMLPKAVQLIDPAETVETVYKFEDLQKNSGKSLASFLRIPGSDPFKPNLKGYKFLTAKDAETANTRKPTTARTTETVPVVKPSGDVVPSVVGLDHVQATEVLKKSGYQVKFHKGDPADGPQLTFHAYKQDPPAKTKLAKGEVVSVVLYTEPAIAQAQGQKGTPAGTVPNVVGLKFEVAKAKLEKAGFRVRFVMGDLAGSADQLHQVQAQAPKAGSKADPESTVALKLYIDDSDAKKARGDKSE